MRKGHKTWPATFPTPFCSSNEAAGGENQKEIQEQRIHVEFMLVSDLRTSQILSQIRQVCPGVLYETVRRQHIYGSLNKVH